MGLSNLKLGSHTGVTLASSADFLKPSKTYATDGKAQIQNKQKIMRMN